MEARTTIAEKLVPERRGQTSSPSYPVALLQRKCACGGTAANAEGGCEECRKKKLQRRAAESRAMNDIPPIVEEVLDSSGQPLDFATREWMEPRFGHDFGQVRVHTDSKASASAKAINAHAYTVGHNVVFASGRYAPADRSGQKLLAHELTHVVQQRKMGNAAPQAKLEIGPVNDSLEQEADRFSEKVAGVSATATATPPIPPSGSPNNSSSTLLQRAPADQTVPVTAPKTAAMGLIVEDDVQQLVDGQMHKTEFLDKLHAEVCSTSDAALKPAGKTSSGCPFIEKWITRLRGRTSAYVERAIRKYAREGAGATRAADYIPPVGAKVQEGVSRWASTGEISGVPPELIAEAMGGGVLGAIGSALGSLASGIGGALSSVGHLFTKANPGGARAADPMAIQAQLNSSTSAAPLEGGVKTRMEAAFGHSFDRVRVHADSRSAQLSSSLNARAFAVGRDVAFAAGEYQPGTLVGDALIAHELAHVIQQSDGESGVMAKGATEYNTLEEDADVSAVSAMVSAWTGAKGSLKDIAKNAMPRLRSGLKLQRCGGKDPVTPVSFHLTQAAEGTPCSAEQRQSEAEPYRSCCTAEMLKEIQGHMGFAKAYVDNAITRLAKPSDGDVSKALMDNFQIRPDDERVSTVMSGLNAVSASMGNVPFRCRSKAEDPECAKDSGRTSFDPRPATPQPYITLCGYYPGEKSKLPPEIARELQGADAGKFVPEKSWVKTLIHEHAHVGAKGNINMPPSGEFYKCKNKYPQEAEKNLVNADCYAWFAMDLSNSGFKCE